MKCLLLLLTSMSIYAAADKNIQHKYSINIVPNNMTVQEKKARFISLFVTPVEKVHGEWMERYLKVKKEIKEGTNREKIEALKKKFDASSDEDLLLRLKPHPVSIVLAQAAMESAWGTSRIFREAKNPFGMWSYDPNEPRIAAEEKRCGKRTVWLKKFKTLNDAIRAYYKTIATGSAYKKFRQLRFKYNDPYKMTPGLDHYSEIGDKYIKDINQIIRDNKFTVYDEKQKNK